MTEHPITPPPELVRRWLSEYFGHPVNGEISSSELDLATKAARWGADQELESCKQVILEQRWFSAPGFRLDQLHNARRPKPPSLKQQALETLKYPKDLWSESEVDTIRRALEALPDD